MRIERMAEHYVAELEALMAFIEKEYATDKARKIAKRYLMGLTSGIQKKNGWQMAEQLGESTPYKIQQFLYRGVWNADTVRDNLTKYISARLGDSDGVLVVEEAGFVKRGTKSAGVKRQYIEADGYVKNCQIGVFVTYAGSEGRTILDRELYLPKEWVRDKERCRDAGVPEDIRFQTKPELALDMVKRAYEAQVPFTWMAGNSIYGDDPGIRMYLEYIGKRYVLALSGNEGVWIGYTYYPINQLLESLPQKGWERLSIATGDIGIGEYDWRYVGVGCSEMGTKHRLLIRRSISNPRQLKVYICHCPNGTLLSELVEIVEIRQMAGKRFVEAKEEVGLGDYEVRSYDAWYKHITMAMCAYALLSVLKTYKQNAHYTLENPVQALNALDALDFKRNMLHR